MCEWTFLPRESERSRRGSSRTVLKDTDGRQCVGEGDEHSRRLFVADDFARQSGRVQDVQQGRERAAGRRRRRQTRTEISADKAVEVEMSVARRVSSELEKWATVLDRTFQE
jgi:hypothetical protein